MNNIMASFNNNTKNWPKFSFGNTSNMNELWSNWMKSFYNYSWPTEGLNYGKSMSQLNNDMMEFSKNSFNDFQTRINQSQKNWTDFNKSMNDHLSKQLEMWNQLMNVFIQSGNKMNECMSETQKNVITESVKQNEKIFTEYQAMFNDLSKFMQQSNSSETLINKEPSIAESKRKPASAVVVQ
jgi:predicted phage tail protein